jgi:phosphopantetheine adenylyltransferase
MKGDRLHRGHDKLTNTTYNITNGIIYIKGVNSINQEDTVAAMVITIKSQRCLNLYVIIYTSGERR